MQDGNILLVWMIFDDPNSKLRAVNGAEMSSRSAKETVDI
jgi:hypothetical protein